MFSNELPLEHGIVIHFPPTERWRFGYQPCCGHMVEWILTPPGGKAQLFEPVFL